MGGAARRAGRAGGRGERPVGAVDHQVALLTGPGDARRALAVMTVANPWHASGKATLAGLARRLLRGL